MKEHVFKVSPGQEGMRLDLFLSQASQSGKFGLSRTSIQRLILQGKVSSNKIKCTKANYKMKSSDIIMVAVEGARHCSIDGEELALDVVYEDNDLAVVNKPSGMVVHPAPGNYEHTLVNALLHRFKKLSDINPARPGIVHRLDKETSGLLVIAKNNHSHLRLAEQFSRHSIKRKYMAVVKGEVQFDENVIELPIGRHPYKRKSMAVGFQENTKYAKTFYRTLKRSKEFSVLELEPYTGRTHQLRVHLAYIGHPILGDSKYGKNNSFLRLALHAQSLGFIHPVTGEPLEFTSALPQEFKQFLSAVKK